jgi:hypothetical protein
LVRYSFAGKPGALYRPVTLCDAGGRDEDRASGSRLRNSIGKEGVTRS